MLHANVKLWKRIENLLRLALPDSGCTAAEQETALREALRIASAARAGLKTTVAIEAWVKIALLRPQPCVECEEPIKSTERAYRRGEEHMHVECWQQIYIEVKR